MRPIPGDAPGVDPPAQARRRRPARRDQHAGIPGPVGPQGPAGATGLIGPTGPTGPGADGTKAINGWTVPFYFMPADFGMLQLDQAGPQLWNGVLGTSWQVDWWITRTNVGAVDIQTFLVCMP